MTAETTRLSMWSPDTRRQLDASYRVDDLLSLPDHAPKFELLDGVMRNVPQPSFDHQDIGALLWFWLRKHAPAEFRASFGGGIVVESATTFEPDVLLVEAQIPGSRHFCEPERVKLAAEVFEPRKSTQERISRPALYASIGIPFYWRIEQDPIHVFAYELVGERYELVTDSTEKIVLTAPFEIELFIRDITP